jgi:hypothetical protein
MNDKNKYFISLLKIVAKLALKMFDIKMFLALIKWILTFFESRNT